MIVSVLIVLPSYSVLPIETLLANHPSRSAVASTIRFNPESLAILETKKLVAFIFKKWILSYKLDIKNTHDL